MPSRSLRILILFSAVALVGGLAWFWWFYSAQSASAQCGSQASSCKNCHEVQGQDSVNAKGEWHVSHAFGDFCANCHAGNVQATDKAAAHTGMIPPLSDVQSNCASCHPADALPLAQKYAAALGVTVNTGGATPAAATAQPQAQPTAAPPAGGQVVASEPGVIDYSQQYDQTVLGQTPINWGNVILGVLAVALAGGGGAFAYWNERRRRAASRPAAVPAPSAAAAIVVEGYSAEVTALLPQIARLSPTGLHALRRLLDNPDPEDTSELLRSLSRLDPELVRRVRGLDRDSRALLLALSGE